MSATDASIRKEHAAEHLELLHTLARELERAMTAIVQNDVAEFEDSIALQQAISDRLTAIVQPHVPVPPASHTTSAVDANLGLQIRAAAEAVRTLNLRYSILLQHASRSVAMMVSLFRSFQGEMQEGSGAGLHHATWSCRV
jgi:hypothetical protein